MLKGEKITLKLVHKSDLGRLYRFHQEIGNRGSYFPLGVMAEPIFKQRFHETGFWEEGEGMLLIVGEDDKFISHIEFYGTVPYWDEFNSPTIFTRASTEERESQRKQSSS